jgi:hypothetical protein
LSVTLALPEVALWSLLLCKLTLFRQVIFTLLVLLLIILFVESGPVLLMLLCAAATPVSIAKLAPMVATNLRNFLMAFTPV